jgi:DivIVA domain-containing protein
VYGEQVTSDEVRKAKFHATWWRGYVPADVDGLLERVAIQLEAHQSPVVTIEATGLRTTHRGYVIQEVDQLLDRLRGVPVEPDDPIFPARAERSGPEMVIRVLVGLGLLAGVTGYILYRVEPKSQHGLWETVGLTGLALGVLWQTFTKLTSTTAFDSGFDVRFFLMGAALFLGGFGGLVTHLSRLTLVNGTLWTVCGLVGGVFVYAEYRDYRLRSGDSTRMAHRAARLRRTPEGEHLRGS